MALIKRMIFISRKAKFFFILGLAVINLVLLTYFHLDGLLLSSLAQLIPTNEWDSLVAPLLKEVSTNKTRFWTTNTPLRHLDVEIPLSRIVPSENINETELFWDPRLTIAAYTNELSKFGNSNNAPTLPFHWADWADVTALNDKLKYRGNPRQITCKRLRLRIRGHPNPDYFCKDVDALTDEEVYESGFLSREQMPQAVIYDHCKHEHQAYNDVRVFMAKSYVLTHLPKPYKVIIFNKNNERGVFEFIVDQERNPQQRLLYSDLTQNLISDSIVKEVDGEKRLSFNHLNYFDKMAKSFPARRLSKEEDVHSLHNVIDSNNGTKMMSLGPELFSHSIQKVDNLIKELESKDDKSEPELNFLNGMKESRKYNGTNEPTYFKMPLLNIQELRNIHNDWGWHYDWRFFNDMLFFHKRGWTNEQRIERTNIILERLLRNWVRFTEEKGIISWIMHGPLLSWYWNGLMFPYDVDIDVQMPISELVRLSKNYNQTLVVENPEEGYGRFLIDIGSYIHNRDVSETGNHIDGRFIDVDSGIYIDITGLSKSTANLPSEYKDKQLVEKADNNAEAEVYNDRRKHFYTLPQLQPLRYSMMNGEPVFIPNKVEERLRFEYETGLDKYEFNGWIFVPQLQLWVLKSNLMKILTDEETHKDETEDIETIVNSVKNLSSERIIKLLQSNDDILKEYFLSKDLAEWHMKEKNVLFDNNGKDRIDVFEDSERKQYYEELVGEISMRSPMRMCLYEYEKFERTAH